MNFFFSSATNLYGEFYNEYKIGEAHYSGKVAETLSWVLIRLFQLAKVIICSTLRENCTLNSIHVSPY